MFMWFHIFHFLDPSINWNYFVGVLIICHWNSWLALSISFWVVYPRSNKTHCLRRCFFSPVPLGFGFLQRTYTKPRGVKWSISSYSILNSFRNYEQFLEFKTISIPLNPQKKVGHFRRLVYITHSHQNREVKLCCWYRSNPTPVLLFTFLLPLSFFCFLHIYYIGYDTKCW